MELSRDGKVCYIVLPSCPRSVFIFSFCLCLWRLALWWAFARGWKSHAQNRYQMWFLPSQSSQSRVEDGCLSSDDAGKGPQPHGSLV